MIRLLRLDFIEDLKMSEKRQRERQEDPLELRTRRLRSQEFKAGSFTAGDGAQDMMQESSGQSRQQQDDEEEAERATNYAQILGHNRDSSMGSGACFHRGQRQWNSSESGGAQDSDYAGKYTRMDADGRNGTEAASVLSSLWGRGEETGGMSHLNISARTLRPSGGKDRHSKVFTAKGPRDRRVRLSVATAIQFYDVQDRLGYDQPSKAVEWLMKKAKNAIDELSQIPLPGIDRVVGSSHHHHHHQPYGYAASSEQQAEGSLFPGHQWSDMLVRGPSSSNEANMLTASSREQQQQLEALDRFSRRCNDQQHINGAETSSTLPAGFRNHALPFPSQQQQQPQQLQREWKALLASYGGAPFQPQEEVSQQQQQQQQRQCQVFQQGAAPPPPPPPQQQHHPAALHYHHRHQQQTSLITVQQTFLQQQEFLGKAGSSSSSSFHGNSPGGVQFALHPHAKPYLEHGQSLKVTTSAAAAPSQQQQQQQQAARLFELVGDLQFANDPAAAAAAAAESSPPANQEDRKNSHA